MKIHIIGGGPAGLYAAILLKKARPAHEIKVCERNKRDDTYGFGIVLSDRALEALAAHDAESHAALAAKVSAWDDIEVHFKGSAQRVGGNGFCGIARTALLRVLQERAQALGVELKFECEVSDIDAAMKSADLVIAADGVNSAVREKFAATFQPDIELRPNRFCWMGSTRPFDAFTFFFRETEHGIFIAHCYQYEAGASTWVIETDPQTIKRAGLDAMDEIASARFLEGVFAQDLDGHKLITNNSVWRNFPIVRCERWTAGNAVLIGDAKATAHFSIGSGTKLAMEDAVALAEAFEATGGNDVAGALKHYEESRRDDVERTQHAADVSLVWFEHVRRFRDMHPARFAFGLMTRAKAITYDDLALRAPEFIAEVDRAVAVETPNGKNVPPMFQPFTLRNMTVANRVVVSPMCQYSATDGVPDDWHLAHYAVRAIGGAGLIIAEMTDVSADARITPGCTGLYSDAQETAWKRIVDFVHTNSHAKFGVQLGHAGRKGSTKFPWDGVNEPLKQGGWPLVAPSPLPYLPQSDVPRAMTRADMDKAVADYMQAAKRADRAGFDMIELHCAHGYLLAEFISPLTNRRTDEYGGSLDNRLRFPLEVFRAVRAAWPQEKPMGVRISAVDWVDGGTTAEDSVEIARAFRDAGCDLIDVSTGQTVADSAPIYGRMYQTPFSDRIRNEAGIATMSVGAITTADQVNTIVAAGRADLVALARPHLSDPNFTLKAAAWYGVDVPVPKQYARGKDQLFSESARAREELNALRRKAKPAKPR